MSANVLNLVLPVLGVWCGMCLSTCVMISVPTDEITHPNTADDGGALTSAPVRVSSSAAVSVTSSAAGSVTSSAAVSVTSSSGVAHSTSKPPDTIRHTVTRIDKKYFDTQMCPYPLTMHVYQVLHHFGHDACEVFEDEKSDYFKDMFAKCSGRMACDMCAVLQARVKDIEGCQHHANDSILLQVECRMSGAAHWMRVITPVGDTLTAVTCPDKKTILIQHVFASFERATGGANTNDLMPCTFVVQHHDRTYYDTIVNTCTGKQTCDGLDARSFPVPNSRNCVDTNDKNITVIYECLEADKPGDSCLESTNPLSIPVIVGIAVGCVVVVAVIIIVVVSIRKCPRGGTTHQANNTSGSKKEEVVLTRKGNQYTAYPPAKINEADDIYNEDYDSIKGDEDYAQIPAANVENPGSSFIEDTYFIESQLSVPYDDNGQGMELQYQNYDQSKDTSVCDTPSAPSSPYLLPKYLQEKYDQIETQLSQEVYASHDPGPGYQPEVYASHDPGPGDQPVVYASHDLGPGDQPEVYASHDPGPGDQPEVTVSSPVVYSLNSDYMRMDGNSSQK